MTSEYELVLITPSGAESSSHKKAVDEVKKLIGDEKGEVLGVDDWGKKDLAYPINKQTSGYYSLINFRSDPSVPNNLNSKMRLMEDLMRYMIVKKEIRRKPVKNKKRESKNN